MQRIIKTIEGMSTRHGMERVFRDWVECMAISIANGATLKGSKLWERREKRYMDIARMYGDEHDKFSEMFAYLIEIFEENPYQDALGKIYMQMGMGNGTTGQEFTPYHIADCMARVSIDSVDLSRRPIRLNDCAVGGGVTMIAALSVLKERGINWQRDAIIVAQDIDAVCCHMAYVQLSLIGARAVIEQRNTLSMELFDTWISPMESMGLWALQPRKTEATIFPDSEKRSDAISELIEPVESHKTVQTCANTSDVENATQGNPEPITDARRKHGTQASLFDLL